MLTSDGYHFCFCSEWFREHLKKTGASDRRQVLDAINDKRLCPDSTLLNVNGGDEFHASSARSLLNSDAAINDESVNLYMDLLFSSSSNTTSIGHVSSYFHQYLLLGDHKHANRYKDTFLNNGRVVVPVHVPQRHHWRLMIMDKREGKLREVRVLDSKRPDPGYGWNPMCGTRPC